MFAKKTHELVCMDSEQRELCFFGKGKKKGSKKKKAGNRKGEMVAYPSYTLTIADGVSPVAIGRPKRYQLCLHCVLSRTRPVLHHSRSFSPSVSVSQQSFYAMRQQ